jgi:hypothetical protein
VFDCYFDQVNWGFDLRVIKERVDQVIWDPVCNIVSKDGWARVVILKQRIWAGLKEILLMDLDQDFI